MARRISSRSVALLHSGSVRDDLSRVIRAARYAARLGFSLSEESRAQVSSTVQHWPWAWGQCDPAFAAPPALASRLRMELDRLLEREPWPQALDLLEQWQALPLLDVKLQQDSNRTQRLRWAQRLGLPLMPSLLLGAADPVAVAQRRRQQRWLQQCVELRDWLINTPHLWRPLRRSGPQPSNNTVGRRGAALVVTLRPQQWKPLLRWWGRWRGSGTQTARDLIAAGWQPGPAIGEELRRQRSAFWTATDEYSWRVLVVEPGFNWARALQ